MLLEGVEVGERSWWAWEGDDGLGPQSHIIDGADLMAAIDSLATAIPGHAGDLQVSSEAFREAPASVRADFASDPAAGYGLHRCMTGDLCDPVREDALARALSRVLLPPGLAERLVAVASSGRRLLLQVLPSQATTAVPWELLSIAPDRPECDLRVADAADVATVAPLLGRDLRPGEQPRADDETSLARPPLWVIDPGSTRVLSRRGQREWLRLLRRGERDTGSPVGACGQPVEPAWLADRLHEPRSRFVYVGHVLPGVDAADTRCELGAAGSGASGEAMVLTAHEVFMAVAGPVDGPMGGSGALSASLSWPMPPRVALIACESGTDLRHAEPFGLVTAFLEAGARWVTATRWPLFTSDAYGHYAGRRVDPLAAASHEIDQAVASLDPVAGVGDWYRTRLTAWRATGALSDSPLLWAAFITYHAPARSSRMPE
ncbi:MAG: hypothetical protein ACK5MT_00240 [Actinomycetales bacterium]